MLSGFCFLWRHTVKSFSDFQAHFKACFNFKDFSTFHFCANFELKLKKVFYCSITLCMLGNFSFFCCRLLTFFKIDFSKKSFWILLECQMVWIHTRTGILHFVGPDLSPNCLQRLSEGHKTPH